MSEQFINALYTEEVISTEFLLPEVLTHLVTLLTGDGAGPEILTHLQEVFASVRTVYCHTAQRKVSVISSFSYQILVFLSFLGKLISEQFITVLCTEQVVGSFCFQTFSVIFKRVLLLGKCQQFTVLLYAEVCLITLLYWFLYYC